jgi:hypothetical protein
MERRGHSSARAAMIYLPSTGDRQRQIADALGDLARTELASSQKSRRGWQGIWYRTGTAP